MIILERLKQFRTTRLYRFIKYAILSLMIVLIVRLVIQENLLEGVERIPVSVIGLSLLFMLLARIFYAYRWQMLMHGVGIKKVPLFLNLRILLFSEFTALILPSYLGGDVVRTWKIERYVDTFGRTAISVLIDRIVGLLGLLILGVLVAPFMARILSTTIPALLIIGVILGFIILGMVLVFHKQLSGLILNKLQEANIRASLLSVSFAISILGHTCFATSYYFLFNALSPQAFFPVFIITVTALLSRTIPVSLFGIEVSDGSLVALGTTIGIVPEETLTVLIVIVLSRYIFAGLGLLLEVVNDGINSIRQLLQVKPTADTLEE